MINVAHDKIACVKTSPQIKSVVSITHVSPGGRMMCCCFELTSLERKQRGLKRKCKITVRIRSGHNIIIIIITKYYGHFTYYIIIPHVCMPTQERYIVSCGFV